jgi:hypothetical protein
MFNFRLNTKIQFVQWGELCNIFSRSATKRAMITNQIIISFISAGCNVDFNPFKEPFFTIPVTMVIAPNHFLFHAINEVMDRIIPAGIPQHYYNFQMWDRYIRNVHVRSLEELQSLTLDDWGFGFVLWLVACGISTVAFLIEICAWPRVKARWIKKWENKNEQMEMKLEAIKPRLDADVLREIEESLDYEFEETEA